MKCLLLIVSFVALSLVGLNSAVGAESVVTVAADEFVRGYSWGWTGRRGEYAGNEAADSMARLAATGVDTACIAFATHMASAQTPEFGWADANPRMVTDEEIRRAIALAREQRLKVILKPVVNCRDRTWRAWIKFFRPVTPEERAAGVVGHTDPWQAEPAFVAGMMPDEAQWEAWWDHYRRFMLHYAGIAQETRAEMLCLGCELSSTEGFEDKWRALIADVREVYDGKLTYNVNHGREQELPWWDAVDVISVSGYYAVPPAEGRSVEEAAKETTPVAEIVAALEQVRARLAEVSAKWDRPILFIETGTTSVRGSARHPWAYGFDPEQYPTDEQEQANYYQAMFEVFYGEPWFMGFAWWDWPARLYPREYAARHRSFCVYGKAAESVLREWYAKPREVAVGATRLN